LARQTNGETTQRLIGWRENPIKGKDPQKPRFGHFAVPTAPWILAGDFLVAENLDGLVFRERRLGAFPL
jgi:hypothetical protein